MQWVQCMDGQTSFRLNQHLVGSRACQLIGERLEMKRGSHLHFAIWIYNDRLGASWQLLRALATSHGLSRLLMCVGGSLQLARRGRQSSNWSRTSSSRP